MDGNRFDRLATALVGAGPRRTLLRLLAPLPVAGFLLAHLPPESEAGRRRRRKRRHDPGGDRDRRQRRRTHKTTGKGKGKKRAPSPPPGCTPLPDATTCAGQCGAVVNNCGQVIDCSAICAGCCDGNTCMASCPGGECCSAGSCVATCPPPGFCGGSGTPGVCGAPSPGTCPDGADYCATGNPAFVGCNSNPSCSCVQTVEGATFCGGGGAIPCTSCTSSADCDPGQVCVAQTPICTCSGIGSFCSIPC
jgi:hypothetical protein